MLSGRPKKVGGVMSAIKVRYAGRENDCMAWLILANKEDEGVLLLPPGDGEVPCLVLAKHIKNEKDGTEVWSDIASNWMNLDEGSVEWGAPKLRLGID